MWTRWSYILAPLIEADSGNKGRKILWDDALEDSFKSLICIVSADTLLIYPNLTIPFMVHTDAFDKQLDYFICHNNKLIAFFSIRLSKLQCNYNIIQKELHAVVEYRK